MQNEDDTRDSFERLDRRQFLGLLGAGGLQGYLSRLRSLFPLEKRERVSVSIKTLPADTDPRAMQIARTLSENLDAAGVDAQIEPMSPAYLYRDVLLDNQFDVYVGRYPGGRHPDFLRPLLHSRYAGEAGWQNPFGLTDGVVDRLLEAQRDRTGQGRLEASASLQREIVRLQPFTVLAFPDELRTFRSDRITGWKETDQYDPLDYLTMQGIEENASEDSSGNSAENADRTVSMALSLRRPLKNLNPIAFEFRHDRAITDLLYDPLGRRIDGEIKPWLADSWTWEESGGGDPTLEVTLRDGLEWHDGEPLDAEDVAFTYRFLQDTSLGDLETAVPAPRFRAQSSIVAGVRAVDDRHVRLDFHPAESEIMRSTLTVPVLPRHHWESQSKPASDAGIDRDETLTKAVVWANRDPVGSGPYRLDAFETRERIELVPYEEHFTTQVDDPQLGRYADGVQNDRLVFRGAPSSTTAVSMAANGTVDGTASEILPDSLTTIEDNQELESQRWESRSFYHVGYNLRRRPLRNPSFRRVVARLLDRETLVETVFDGCASPAASPLSRHDVLASDLQWNGSAPKLPFFGQSGDLDVERVRTAFRDAGYEYDEDENLVE